MIKRLGMVEVLKKAKKISYELALLQSDVKNKVLMSCAEFILKNTDEILIANNLDITTF